MNSAPLAKRSGNAAAVTDLKAEDRRRALAAADQRMQAAKHRFSLAALACMRGALDAEQQVQAALQEIDLARAALRQVEADA